jgi:hypothetical protein
MVATAPGIPARIVTRAPTILNRLAHLRVHNDELIGCADHLVLSSQMQNCGPSSANHRVARAQICVRSASRRLTQTNSAQETGNFRRLLDCSHRAGDWLAPEQLH